MEPNTNIDELPETHIQVFLRMRFGKDGHCSLPFFRMHVPISCAEGHFTYRRLFRRRGAQSIIIYSGLPEISKRDDMIIVKPLKFVFFGIGAD